MNRLDHHLDAELLELDLQQPRHGLERLRRILLLLLLGYIEDGNRRQSAFDRGVDE